MRNIFFRRAGVFVLSAMIALTMSSGSVFAAGPKDSDHQDYNTARSGYQGQSKERQENAAATTVSINGGTMETVGANSAVVTLGKIMNVNQKGKFPNVDAFIYKVTPVGAWDNANESTEKSGSAIAVKDMPQPAASAAADHVVRNVSEGGNYAYSAVSIGNFRDENQNNTSTTANSTAAANTDGISQNLRRTRTTDLKFTFNRAGYYMYRVEEVGSSKNGSIDSWSKNVAGMDYDDNTYYMVFYVANKQAAADSTGPAPNEYGQGIRKGDTQGQYRADGSGVYVHTITSWTNQRTNEAAGKAATDKKPDNSMRDSDALNAAHDLMNAPDGGVLGDNTGSVDHNNKGVTNNSNTAGSNGDNGTAAVTNPGVSSITHDNLGKVGVSTPEKPNVLEAYRMWNAQTTHDVVLKKNVTGNLGDRTKQFEFTVVLTGLENNQTYTTNIAAGTTDMDETSGTATNDMTSAGVVLYEAGAGCTLKDSGGVTTADQGKAFVSSGTGTATFKVKLKDDEILVINALPRSASYQITEAASDHVAQFDIVSTNKAATGNMAVIGNQGKNNTSSNTNLATDTEFVDRYDGTMTVIYQNNRDLAAITGVPGLDYMVYIVIASLLTAAVCGILRRRKLYDDEL